MYDQSVSNLSFENSIKTDNCVFSKKSLHKTSQKDVLLNSNHQFNQQQGLVNVLSGVPVVSYGQPVQGSGVLAPNNVAPYSYPSGVYPVPVYVSYAPVLPPIQNPMVYHTGYGPNITKR